MRDSRASHSIDIFASYDDTLDERFIKEAQVEEPAQNTEESPRRVSVVREG